MSISATTGSAANSASAVASLALPSFTLTAGQNVYVAVALGSTSSSVISITDTHGNTYSLVAALNGTGVRVELWKSDAVGAQTSNIITVNISPSTTIAAAAEEYAGVSAEGSSATASGSDNSPRQRVTTTQGNNWALGALGFVTGASTTETAQNGTDRQNSIAASAVGVALYDNTQLADGALLLMTLLNSSQNWATSGVELKTGGAAIPVVDYAATTAPHFADQPVLTNVANQSAWSPNLAVLKVTEPLGGSYTPSYYTPVPLDAHIQDAVVAAGYSGTLTTQGGTAPYTYAVTSGALPTGLSLSSAGVLAGVPTTLGAFTFTVTVTDANGHTGSQAFTLTVTTPMRVNSGYVV